MTRNNRLLSILVLCAGITLSAGPTKAEGGITVELNKLETVGKDCRIYMVFSNATKNPIAGYKPDLVFFGTDGVIADRLIVEGGPLPAGKTRVKLFDLAGLGCGALGHILLNDIRACDGADLRPDRCLSMTRTASRAKVEFIK